MIRRLAHLNFITTDLPRMVDFYTNGLGLPVKFTMENDDKVTFGYYIDCGDSTFIEIFDRDLKVKQWGGQIEELVPGNRYAHFCLEVTDLQALRETLIAKGISVTEVRTGMDHSLQAWARDPDGNAIELMQYTATSRQIQR
jgi:catechol 2,3-dioxygenase-like lactoylglutathione lyase family enzyme